MSKKNNIHIGLDLGIASVGWAIVNEEQEIIARGSHLFPQLSKQSTNGNDKYGEGTRGEKRRSRRILNRKKQRKIDFLCSIDKHCYPNQIKFKNKGKYSKFYKEEFQNIFGFNKEQSATDFLFHEAHKYDIWKIYKKGFDQELNPKELFLFLYFKLNNRGVFHLSYSKPENYGYEQSVLKKYFEDIYLKQYGKYRSKHNGNNSFSIFHNWYDVEVVLNNCSYLSEEFISFYRDDLFFRHRDFSKGPGQYISELKCNPSKWGIEYDENGNPKQKYLWDRKIGKCKISISKNNGDDLKSEYKLPSFYSINELCNIISQLVFCRKIGISNNERLLKDEIIDLINRSIFEDKSIGKTLLSSILEIDKKNILSSIKGAPLTKTKDDFNFEQLKKYRSFFKNNIIEIDKKNIFGKLSNGEYLFEYIHRIQKLRHRLIAGDENSRGFFEKSNIKGSSQNIDFDECKNVAEEESANRNLIIDDIKINYDNLCNFSNFSESDLYNTSNFGFSSYTEYLKYFAKGSSVDEIDSFNQYFKYEIKEGDRYTYNISNKSIFISPKIFDKQDFISPNAKNSITQAIRIINKILKDYIFPNKDYNLKSIILESTWDSNDYNNTLLSKERKKEISIFQKWNEKQNEIATEKLKEYDIKVTKENIKRMILLTEQKNCDAYSGNPLTEFLDKNHFENLQIDHIIPESISFNGDYENLVVTCENSSKSNMTPISYLKDKFYEMEKLWNEWYLSSKDKGIYSEIKKKKYSYLTMEKGEEFNQGFINSNLCETTYAIRKLKDALSYFILNLNDENGYFYKNDRRLNQIKDCDVRTISCSRSQLLRSILEIEKDRNIDESHHSIDAAICSLYSSLDVINNLYWRIKTKYFYTKEYQSNFKNKFNPPKKSDLQNIFKVLKEKILDQINKNKCIYSCKYVSLFYKNYFRQPVEKQFENLKNIKSSNIFSNELPSSYVLNSESNKKHEILKINLLGENNTDIKNTNELFKKIYIKNKNSTEEDIKIYCKDNNIITNYKIINNLFQYVVNKNLFENFSNEKESIFVKIRNEYLSDIEILKSSICKSNINTDNIENLLKEYIPIFINNNEYILIKYIKYIDSGSFTPARDYTENPLKLNNSKSIFDLDKTKCFLKNKANTGISTKCLCIVEYDDKNKKRKRDFFKIDQLNKIINKPNDELNPKIIKIIDYDKWFKIDGKIWKISNFDINKNQITITCKSNSEKKIIKPYSTLSTSEVEHEKLIFEYLLS